MHIPKWKELPSRGLDIAIREYAPGAQVVIDGRVHRSVGVSLQWHSGGMVNEAQKFDIAWRCAECGSVGVMENAYSNSDDLSCTHCQADIPLNSRKDVLRPGGFVTDFFESASNDVTSQKFIRVERPRIHLLGEAMALPDVRCGFIKYGHKGSVFYHSSGEHEHGYAVCMNCGRADSMTSQNNTPKALMPDEEHRPVGGGRVGSQKDKNCSGEAVKKNVYLGYQITTDVLELFLKNPKTGQWLSDHRDDQVIATTIAVALRDVVADRLGISTSEMGFSYRLDKDLATNTGRSVIQIFDQASGGAGFVLAGLDDVVGLLKAVKDKLICKVDCDNVCSSCLAAQDSRVEQEELDRKGAKAWLDAADFYSFLSLPSSMDSIPGVSYCSRDAEYFVRKTINSLRCATSEVTLRLVLTGDSKQWDLGYSTFRDVLFKWQLIDKVLVQLCIDTTNELSKKVKLDLSKISELGIDVVEPKNVDKTYGVPLVMQLSSDNDTHTLFCTDNNSLIPGEQWLQSSSSAIWASSKKIQSLPVSKIDMQSWSRVDSGTSVIKFTEELNGSVRDLSKRLESLLKQQAIGFYELLQSDQVESIVYSDRYMKSPWSAILLSGFIEALSGDGLQEIIIHTLQPNSNRSSYLAFHDWQQGELY